MKLIDLLNSDFEHYYFLCDENEFEFEQAFEWYDKKLKGMCGIVFNKRFVNKKGITSDLYDLGYCLCNYLGCNMSVNRVAKLLDKSNLFKFKYMEHEDDTLYIHLERK